MPRPRVSIASTMAFVVCIAVGFAALRNASRVWAGIVFLLTLGMLCTAVVGACSRRGRARPPWLGFAVFGWAYALAALGPWNEGKDAAAPTFVATALLDELMPYASRNYADARGTTYDGELDFIVDTSTGLKIWSTLPYRRIGHCVLTLGFAAAGAVVGALFAARDQRDGRVS
jgi:hypothetical protein